MVGFFVEIKFYSFAIFLSNQLWILIFLNEMSTRPMQQWLITSNEKYYRVRDAFNDLGDLYWRKKFKGDIRIGDEVFIYLSKPIGKIMLKTVCINNQASSSDELWNKDIAYYKQDVEPDKNLPCLHLKFVQMCDDESLSFDN